MDFYQFARRIQSYDPVHTSSDLSELRLVLIDTANNKAVSISLEEIRDLLQEEATS